MATGAHDRAVLPGVLRSTPAFPFVGRSTELATLVSLLPGSVEDVGRVALLSGESGSGKSRLVRELAQLAADRGLTVLYGASDAVVNTPYQPFVESLELLVRVVDPDVLREDLGVAGGELTRLLPELVQRVGPLESPLAADPDTERHRLHTAAGELLAAVSSRAPLLLVAEDLHWADAPSLHLFRHLARTSADSPLLLVATFRDREADVRPEFAEALADISRTEGMVRLRLSGLSGEDVADFVRRSAGAGAEADLTTVAEALVDLTAGNPFLLCELWRALVESDALELVDGHVRLVRPLEEVASPESVRDVVSHRLARLAEPTRALLDVAAVVGQEFELGVLASAAQLEESALGAALEEAVRSGTIEEVSGARLAHRFTHELVRRALYDRLTGVRRAELHLRVAEALEREHAANLGPVLPDLAHHFAVAAGVGGSAKAIEYNVRAADAATASLAFEEADLRLSQALELGIPDPGLEADVRLKLGTARYLSGETAGALEAFTAAGALARSLGDGTMLAVAAVGFEEACWAPGISDRAVDLLQEASAALGDEDSSLRARLLAALGRALVFAGEHRQGAVARQQSIEMARRLGDPQTLASVLVHAYWARATVPLEEVLALLTEARDLGAETGDAEIEAQATAWRVVTLVGLCDLEGARAERDALLRVAARSRQPLWLHIAEQFGSALALCDGRLDDAEAMAQRSWEWSPYLRGRDPSGVHGVQIFSVRREQGRLAELEPMVQLLSRAGAPAWRPGLVALLVELGLAEEARVELRRMRAGGFATVPRDSLWLASLAYLTDACSVLDDAESAALLYPELEPLSGGTIQIAQLVACYGAADRYLGMLARVLGHWETAQAHFEYALYLNRRMQAHTWTAHTSYEYARMLLGRDGPRDRERAAELLADAAASAERLALVALETKIAALRPGEAPRQALPDGLSAREVEVLRLVARGRSNREIGQELFISEHTAANHIRSILRKTGCANRTDAASYAYRHALAGH